jgi:hypothetical protein
MFCLPGWERESEIYAYVGGRGERDILPTWVNGGTSLSCLPGWERDRNMLPTWVGEGSGISCLPGWMGELDCLAYLGR